MAVKRVKREAAPPSRFHDSLLYKTKEWKDALREIKRGLAAHEAIKVQLSSETIAALPLKDPVRAFYVNLKRKVKQEKFPVTVFSRSNEDAGEPGMDIWIVGK